MNLFPNKPQPKTEQKHFCRNCKHAQKWEVSRSGKTLYYCGIRKSNRTFNGLQKIRLKDEACKFWNWNIGQEND